jgi:AAA+ superfamily predicted ATPase
LFDLTPCQVDILLICLLPQLDSRYRRLYGYLQDDASRSTASAELVRQVLAHSDHASDAYWADFHPSHRLFAEHLLCGDRENRPGEPSQLRPLIVSDRVVAFLLGSDDPDERVARFLSPVGEAGTIEELPIEPDLTARLTKLAASWRRNLRGGAAVLLHGPDGSGRFRAAAALAAATGVPLLRADTKAALDGPLDWPMVVDLCYREARLRGQAGPGGRPAAVYWSCCEHLIAGDGESHDWNYLLDTVETHGGLSLLESSTAWEPSGRFRGRLFVQVDFSRTGFTLRRRLWERHLPTEPRLSARPATRDELAERLASGFMLTDGQIQDAVATAFRLAVTRDAESPVITSDDLLTGCRRQVGRRLDNLAKRVEPRTSLGFDDLVLPGTAKRRIEELGRRIRNRSRIVQRMGLGPQLGYSQGVVALFAGPSGTGKTMAAELLAAQERLDLYKVDLASIVSKYVGETEKQIRLALEQSRDGNAILFFDEADSLFAKRGDVRDARDRWANLETNYLLQALEGYPGVVILATNLRKNIDDAFRRRLDVVVEFPLPDAPARVEMVRRMLPHSVECPADAEIERFARQFQICGGNIRNVVLDAAFRSLARANGRPPRLTLRDLVISVAREYEKMGKPVSQSEFGSRFLGWYEQYVVDGDDE